MGKKIYILTAVCVMLMILLFIMLDRCNVGAYIGLSDNYDWLAFVGSCLGILVAVYVPIYVLQETLRHEKEDSLRSEKRSVCMEIIADISSLIALHKKAVHYAGKDNEKENYEHASIEFWEKYSFLKMKLSNVSYSRLASGACGRLTQGRSRKLSSASLSGYSQLACPPQGNRWRPAS